MTKFLLPFRERSSSFFLSPLAFTLLLIISIVTISIAREPLSVTLIFIFAFILFLFAKASIKRSLALIASGSVIIFFLGIPSLFLHEGILLFHKEILGINFGLYSFGLYRATSIWIKGVCSVTLVTLYSSAITMQEFIQSLKGLFVPNVIILIVLMILRYAPMFYTEASEIRLAQKLRGLDYAPRKRQFYAAASMFGSTLIRSLIHGEEVFQAMILRGLEGFDIVKRKQIKFQDPFILLVITIIFSFIAGGIIQCLLI